MAIYYADQGKNKIRLLQSSKAKLSTYISNEGKIQNMINCSFFASDYVIGRDQGDERNNTVDQTNFEGNSIVIFKDGNYKIGYYNSWDYQNDVVAGFSPCAIYRNGQLEISPSLKNKWTPNIAINRTALCYNDDGFHFIVATNITYEDLATAIWEKYKAHFIAFLDSGGSSELLNRVNNKLTLAFTPSDGVERNMFNGLAFVDIETPTPEPTDLQKPVFPTKSTWVSQAIGDTPSHMHTKAIDFGTWKYPTTRGLPSDYDYPIYAPFDCKVVRRDSDSIGAMCVLESINKVEFSNGDKDYCSVCIGHSSDAPSVNKEYKQNDLVCHFGTAGGVPKHLHLEVIKGQFSEIYAHKSIAVEEIKGVGNVYLLESTIEPYKCLYLTEDTYIEDNPYDWKILKDDPSESEEVKKLKKQIVALELQVKDLENKNKELQEVNDLQKLENESLKKDLNNANEKLKKIEEVIKA